MPIPQRTLEDIRNNKSSLRSLDLSKQNLDDNDIAELVSALSTNTHLTSLNLRDNKITDKGAKLLAGVATLKELKLYNGNKITSQGLTPFLENFTLTSFVIVGGSGSTIDALRKHINRPRVTVAQTNVTHLALQQQQQPAEAAAVKTTKSARQTKPRRQATTTYHTKPGQLTPVKSESTSPSPRSRKLEINQEALPAFTHVLSAGKEEVVDANESPLRQLAYGEQKTKRSEGSPFTDNITAALELKLSDKDRKIITEKKLRAEKINSQVKLSRAYITEHAARRVDLAFYTFIAYYQSKLAVELGDTSLQFGVGNRTDKDLPTDGSHSALITSFVDSTITREKSHKKPSMLDGTFFHKSLNATVELPQGVNLGIDRKLEGYRFEKPSAERLQYIDLINRVSQGKLTPIAALHQYLIMMEDFFATIKQSNFVKEGEKREYSPSKSRSLSLNYEEEGTFRHCWLRNADMKDERQLQDDYIHALLRISVDEVHLSYRSEAYREKIYHHAYAKIQAEIFEKPFEQQLELDQEDLAFLQRCKTPPKSIAESLQFFKARKAPDSPPPSDNKDTIVKNMSARRKLTF